MARKFKHKKLDFFEAHEVGRSGESYAILNNGQKQGEIPSNLVENSNDWQEITEPELVEGRWVITNKRETARIKQNEGNDLLLDNIVDRNSHFIGRFYIARECIKREATPEEIHKALEAIRKHKGLVEGVKVKDAETGEVRKIANENFIYQKGMNVSIDVFSGEYIASGRSRGTFKLYSRGNWAEKVEEKPILVTEDGYSKYEGDNYWFVDSDLTLFKGTANSKAIYIEENKRFHFKENAEAYIENKKPRYSNEDLDWICNKVKSIIFDAD